MMSSWMAGDRHRGPAPGGPENFLTASVEERARRRCRGLQARGQVDLATIQAEIAQRDYADSHRSAAPLRKAADAVVVDTSQMDREESLAALITLAKERLGL